MNSYPKCQIHSGDTAYYAWQPFGPEEDYRDAVTELGAHYRGFPVIKIGQIAYEEIKKGDSVRFTYKDIDFIALNGEVLRQNEFALRVSSIFNKKASS